MSVDLATVKRVARLARIAVTEDDAERMTGELNNILGFVAQLDEVNVDGVEPLISMVPMALRRREDVVTDGTQSLPISSPMHRPLKRTFSLSRKWSSDRFCRADLNERNCP
jgi:aspartyl-tRNA(Asn)/glutamyl-tRNA(Gln) amidotransferase subunit C